MDMRQEGLKTPLMSEELKEMFRAKEDRMNSMNERSREKLMEKFNQTGERGVSPALNEEDVLFLSQTRRKMSQRQILKNHVKNHADLDLRSRRKVMGHIQAQRAMHAKEIFLKELATVGNQ